MSDEFPTLEVALAASVAVLAWRGLLLRRTRLGFLSASDRLLQSFRHGPPSVRELTAAQLGPLLEPLARAALTAHASETGKAVGERTGRVPPGSERRGAGPRDLRGPSGLTALHLVFGHHARVGLFCSGWRRDAHPSRGDFRATPARP